MSATPSSHRKPFDLIAAPLAPRVLADASRARLVNWGLRDYSEILDIQESLRAQRQQAEISDTWLVGEHPTVITQGVRGAAADFVMPHTYPVYKIDRGGQTTVHAPGQLVIYPIVRTHEGMLAQARMSLALLESARVLVERVCGVTLNIQKGRPGLFFGAGVEERKIAAIGISIRKRVTMHGIAINVSNSLAAWDAIIACGEPQARPGALNHIAPQPPTIEDFLQALPDWLRSEWGYAGIAHADFATLQDAAGEQEHVRTL